jgi:hypothetical protein
MCVVVAYDIYKEVAEGKADADWKLNNKTVDFYTFRETLAQQMLAYNPKALKYMGDDKMRAVTNTARAKHPTLIPPTADGDITTTTAGVGEDALLAASTARLLCGFVSDLKEHFNACQTMEDKGKHLACSWCGVGTYQFCGICKVAMHKFPHKDTPTATPCFFHYHDTGCLGLAKMDFWLMKQEEEEGVEDAID